MGPVPVPPRCLWWLGAGFAVWCLALVALYATHAIGCTFAWPGGELRIVLVVQLLASLVVIGWMWRRFAISRADPEHGANGSFLQQVALWSLIVAWVSTVLTLGPPLFLSTCL